MKHGLKFRKLSRTSSHRAALLRNLVSSLLHHESIKTTVPKAKETARLAEKIITYGKRNTDPARRQAQAFLLPPHHYTDEAFANGPVEPIRSPFVMRKGGDSALAEDDMNPENFRAPATLLPKVFTTLAERYKDRAGGYTRIQRFGRRPGDYAPVAIVSLVDGPRDVKFEMAARAVALETAAAARNFDGGVDDLPQDDSLLRPRTAKAREKVLKFRGDEGKKEFEKLSKDYGLQLAAEHHAIGHRRPVEASKYAFLKPSKTTPQAGRRIQAGERLPGMSTHHTGLGLARGALGRRRAGVDRTPLFVTEVPVSRQSRVD